MFASERPRPDATPSMLYDVIDSIGLDRFGNSLIRWLNQLSGADHCSGFVRNGGHPIQLTAASLDGTDTARKQTALYLTSLWRRDPMLADEAAPNRTTPRLSRMAIADMPDAEFRDTLYGRTGIRDRVVICGTRSDSKLGISVLSSHRQGAFSPQALALLRDHADVLLSVVSRHAQLTGGCCKAVAELTNLPRITAKIGQAGVRLPRREAEVCARILYGLSGAGIAADLGIGMESVATYRKRAYERLEIATHRELLLWFMLLPEPIPKA